MTERDARPRSALRRGSRALLVAALAAAWILPVLVSGLFDLELRWAPRFMRHLYRVSCLFPHRVVAWNAWYVQVEYERQPGWWPVDEADISRLEPFGYHTRMDFILNTTNNPGPLARAERQELADYVARRMSILHPVAPRVIKVRFVRAMFPPSDALASQHGAWRKPDLRVVPRTNVRVGSEHEIRP